MLGSVERRAKMKKAGLPRWGIRLLRVSVSSISDQGQRRPCVLVALPQVAGFGATERTDSLVIPDDKPCVFISCRSLVYSEVPSKRCVQIRVPVCHGRLSLQSSVNVASVGRYSRRRFVVSMTISPSALITNRRPGKSARRMSNIFRMMRLSLNGIPASCVTCQASAIIAANSSSISCASRCACAHSRASSFVSG